MCFPKGTTPEIIKLKLATFMHWAKRRSESVEVLGKAYKRVETVKIDLRLTDKAAKTVDELIHRQRIALLTSLVLQERSLS